MILEIHALSCERSTCRQCACRAVNCLDSMAFQYRNEQVHKLVVRLHAEILLVVPLRLFRVETGSRLDDAVQRECFYQLFDAEDFLVVARIPAKHCQHVHECLREISVLTIAVGYLAFCIDPPERENREAETVAVAFAELALAVRFQKQGEMRETRHGLLPAESLVEHIVERQ